MGLQKVGHDCVTNTDAILSLSFWGDAWLHMCVQGPSELQKTTVKLITRGKTSQSFRFQASWSQDLFLLLTTIVGTAEGFYVVDCIY